MFCQGREREKKGENGYEDDDGDDDNESDVKLLWVKWDELQKLYTYNIYKTYNYDIHLLYFDSICRFMLASKEYNNTDIR